MTAPWWAALGPAEAAVRCGGQQHRLRWEAGRLTAKDHPDAEGEQVLGTLGGDQPDCIRLLSAWGEHSDDLNALMLGPRSAADTLTVDVAEAERLRLGPVGWVGYAPLTGGTRGAAPARPLTWGELWFRTLRSFAVNARGLPRGSATWGPGRAAVSVVSAHVTSQLISAAGSRQGPRGPRAFLPGAGQDLDRELARRAELLELLALGPAFQFRLCATVAAAWADREPGPARPALTAALAGRVAPAVASWLGADADAVQVSLADEQGGLARDGDRWRAGMRWVAAVWGAGLAVVDGNLVVDVTRAEYPEAHVLALDRPGGKPTPTAVAVQCEGAADSPQGPRWRIIGP